MAGCFYFVGTLIGAGLLSDLGTLNSTGFLTFYGTLVERGLLGNLGAHGNAGLLSKYGPLSGIGFLFYHDPLISSRVSAVCGLAPSWWIASYGWHAFRLRVADVFGGALTSTGFLRSMMARSRIYRVALKNTGPLFHVGFLQ